MDETDPIFRALADGHRRVLLDRLQERDGQTLGELCAALPGMTRFGCMKHLRVLEEAGLVVARKVGRQKFHYLNPVPIQRLYDRWVSKYARPWTRTLAGLKNALEERGVGEQGKHERVFQVFIRTTPERLWQALTDGAMTERYYFGSRVESTWEVGAPLRYPNPAGGDLIAGEVLEVEPPRRLVTTFRPLWTGNGDDATSTRVTWEIEPEGEVCKLTVIHDGLDPARPLTPGIVEGWARILSGLKTLLETGEPLVVAR